MSKNETVRVGAVTLVVVMLASAMILTSCKKAAEPSTPAGSTGSTTASSTATSTANTSTVATQGQAATVPTATTNNGTGTGTTPKPSTTTTGGTTPQAAIGPFKELPDPGIPAETVKSPYPAGKKLPPLATAPNDTISAVKLGAIPTGSAYKVTLRPYGIGPSILLGSRLAVKLDKVTPKNGAPVFATINNANLLVLVDTSHDGTITKGGTYTAWIVFQSDGSKLLPVMSRVTKQ